MPFWNLLVVVVVGVSIVEAVSTPTFVVLPRHVVAKSGGTASLHCSAVGHQPLNYWWTRNSQKFSSPNVVFHSNGTLQLVIVATTDAAEYQCFANNSIGSVASNVVDLEIAVLGVFSSRSSPVVSVAHGSYSVLPCNTPTSVPKAAVTWFRDGVIVDLDSRGSKAMMTLEDELVISPADSGASYKCVAENKILNIKKTSDDVFLSLLGMPVIQSLQILYGLEDTQVVLGSTAVFQCIVVNSLVPTIQWRKDGSSSLPSPRIHSDENDRKLVITNAMVSDGGVYKCLSGGKTASARLTVLAPPVIHSGPQDSITAIGATVYLTCNTSGVPTPSVSWFKNGVELSGVATVNTGLVHSLKLTNVHESDNGAYQCRSSNEAGIAFASAAVIVQAFPPTFTQGGKLQSNIIAFRTSATTLPCSAIGSPPPTYKWLFRDLPLVAGSNLQVLQAGSLAIGSVQLKNAGKYTCIATNQKGSIRQSTILAVYTETAFADDVTTVYGLAGDLVVLSCQVRYDSRLYIRVQWTKNELQVKTVVGKVTVSGHDLVFHNVTVGDGGDYDCSVSTQLSAEGRSKNVIRRTVQLLLQEPPSPPQNVEVTSKARTAVLLKWQAPESDGNAKNSLFYFIEYNSSISREFVRSSTQTDARTARISGLHPYVEYQFRVVASNDVGESNPSYLSRAIRTLPDSPTSSPLNLKTLVNPDSPEDSFVVVWGPTPSPGVNGPVVEYHVEYRQENGSKPDSWTRVAVNGSSLNVSLTSLGVYKLYLLRIRVVNSEGVGPWSDEYRALTGELPPFDPPEIERVNALGAYSLRLEFTPPRRDTHNGILRGFKVWYWPNDPAVTQIPADRHELTVSSPQASVAIISNLNPNTKYNLVMVAYNNAGNSPVSLREQQITAEAKPGSVTNVEFNQDVVNGEISVRWNPPGQQVGTITKYFISYQQVGDIAGKTLTVDGNVQFVVLSGIQSDAAYNVSIQAASSVGEGALWTTAIEFGKGRPGPPIGVRVIIVDNQPTVSWMPGSDGGSEIIGYKVEYSQRDNSEWQLYSRDISSSTSEVTLPAHLLDGGASEYEFRVAVRNRLGFGSPTVAQEASGFTSGKAVYEELWFLIVAAVVGGLLLVIFVITVAVCWRRRRISYKIKQANEDIDTIEERFPPARKTVTNGIIDIPSTTMSSRPRELNHYFNLSSPERRSENSSALGPPAYAIHYNPRLQMQIQRAHTPSCDDSNTVTSSDVDKPDVTESEFSEPPVRVEMPTFRDSTITETEGDDPASVSTFV